MANYNYIITNTEINKSFIEWENGADNSISEIILKSISEFIKENTEEENSESIDKKEKTSPHVSGIVAWYLLFRNQKDIRTLCEDYFQMRFQQFKDKQERKTSNHNIKEVFLYKYCLNEEISCLARQEIYSYVSKKGGKQIQSIINRYFNYIECQKLLIHINEHMDSEEMVSLEYKILDILSLHGKEIDANLKDSKQIYDFPELRLYTEAEIREASIDMQIKGWITCFIDDTEGDLGPAYWHELLDEGRKALRKHIALQGDQQAIDETLKQQHNVSDIKIREKPCFNNLLQCADKESMLIKLHQHIDTFGGKQVALILLKAREEKIISKLPSKTEFESEFKNFKGVWRSISHYFNPNCNPSPDFSNIVLPQFGIVQTTNPNCLHYFP